MASCASEGFVRHGVGHIEGERGLHAYGVSYALSVPCPCLPGWWVSI